jgi:hypothetical protein
MVVRGPNLMRRSNTIKYLVVRVVSEFFFLPTYRAEYVCMYVCVRVPQRSPWPKLLVAPVAGNCCYRYRYRYVFADLQLSCSVQLNYQGGSLPTSRSRAL